MEKIELHNFCKKILEAKLFDADKAWNELKQSGLSSGKSAMGDKYETQAELIKQEQDKLHSVKQDAALQYELLCKIPLDDIDKAVFGALVSTNIGRFYLSIPLGKVNFEGEDIFCVSMKSPLALAMLNRKQGEDFVFNGRNVFLQKIG